MVFSCHMPPTVSQTSPTLSSRAPMINSSLLPAVEKDVQIASVNLFNNMFIVVLDFGLSFMIDHVYKCRSLAKI